MYQGRGLNALLFVAFSRIKSNHGRKYPPWDERKNERSKSSRGSKQILPSREKQCDPSVFAHYLFKRLRSCPQSRAACVTFPPVRASNSVRWPLELATTCALA